MLLSPFGTWSLAPQPERAAWVRSSGPLPEGRWVVVSHLNGFSLSAVFQISTSWGSIQRKENQGAQELFTNNTHCIWYL